MHIKNTLFVGKVLLAFEALDSTNGYALELLAKSKPIEGTVISTFRQTEGRGQIGSKWESEPDKNLSLSIILYPTFLAPREQFALNISIALAVRTFVAKYTEKMVKVKWPNDIYIESRKIAGILIQNSITMQAVQFSVIGVGVNINQTQFSKNVPNATSLAAETGQGFALHELLEPLCQEVEQHYLHLKNTQYRIHLQENYLSYLYQYQQVATFQRADGSIFSGIITGISDSGKLLIQNKGVVEIFDLKEVRFL